MDYRNHKPLNKKQKKACEELTLIGAFVVLVLVLFSGCVSPPEEVKALIEAGANAEAPMAIGSQCQLPPPRKPDICERCLTTCGDAGVRRCSHNNGTSEENCECK